VRRAGLALVLALGACVAREAPLNGAPIPFLDAHVHLNDEAMQLDLMQRFGAERAVVFWGRRSDNAAVAAAARRHSGRLLAFASISPERSRYRAAWAREDAGLLDELDALLATGLYVGIGELSLVHAATPGFAATATDLDGTLARGVFALARKHRVPLLLHVEASHREALEARLAADADVDVIWAHAGYLGAADARAVLERHPRLVLELSARTWPRHPRSEEYPIVDAQGRLQGAWRSLIEAFPDRFVVGTDASHHDPDREAMKAASVQTFLRQLPPSVRDRVARGTLSRLLRLSSP
jgi:predicted TIM-barrel fold metal-dependent hydrolase